MLITVRYEELPQDEDDEFQNKITLGKKFNSETEPKVNIYSVQQLIEAFCKANSYLAGQEELLNLVDQDGRPFEKGIILSSILPKGSVNNLRLIKGSGKGNMRGTSINDNDLRADFNPQEMTGSFKIPKKDAVTPEQ